MNTKNVTIVVGFLGMALLTALWWSRNGSSAFQTRFQPVKGVSDVWLDTQGLGYLDADTGTRGYTVGVNLESSNDEFISFRYSTNGKITAILGKLLIVGADGKTNIAAYVDRNADGIPESRVVIGEGWEALFQGEFYPLKDRKNAPESAGAEDERITTGKIEVNGELIDVRLENYMWKKQP